MAGHDSFKRYTRSDRTSASDQNRLREAVENLQRGGGVDARRMQGVLVPLQEPEPFFFIVLDGPSDCDHVRPKYTAWHEVDLDEDGSVVQFADTLVGSALLPAYSESGYDAPASGVPYLARMSMQETAVLFFAYPPWAVRMIQITSLNQVNGFYPAVELVPDPVTRTWIPGEHCWWWDANA